MVDHGSLQSLTRSHSAVVVAHFAQVGAGFASSVVGQTPTPPPGSPNGPGNPIVVPGTTGGGGGGNGPQTVVDLPTPKGHHHSVATPEGSTGTSGGGSGGGASGGGSGGGSGGTLPFTGYAVLLTAGIGVVFAGAGGKLRRVLRRGN